MNELQLRSSDSTNYLAEHIPSDRAGVPQGDPLRKIHRSFAGVTCLQRHWVWAVDCLARSSDSGFSRRSIAAKA